MLSIGYSPIAPYHRLTNSSIITFHPSSARIWVTMISIYRPHHPTCCCCCCSWVQMSRFWFAIVHYRITHWKRPQHAIHSGTAPTICLRNRNVRFQPSPFPFSSPPPLIHSVRMGSEYREKVFPPTQQQTTYAAGIQNSIGKMYNSIFRFAAMSRSYRCGPNPEVCPRH